MKNRVCIYVFYDKDGIVDGYVSYMLKNLLSVCQRLVVVCNGEINDAGRAALSEFTEEIVVRENKGFDAWAYKAGFEYIGWDKISEYDELILMNDTVFGPLYPLRPIFDEMDGRELDFWGITKHGTYKNPDGLTKGGIFPEHIQSYFLVFRSRMLASEEFKTYWEKLRRFKTWNETVSFFETQFTKYFASLGFKWDVFANTDNEFSEFNNVSLILQLIYELVKDYKCPFIKRKSFTLEYGNFLNFTIGDSTRKAFDYIREETDYNVDLIWNHILRTGSLRNIKDNLHLNYILPEKHLSDSSANVDNARVALFAHITYEDQIDFCLSYLKSGNDVADLYITTLSKHVEEIIIKRVSAIWKREFKVITLPENSRGRDVGALWVVLKQYIKSYDYICFIHNKKSPQIKPLTVGRGFAQRNFINLLASKEYLINIFNLFDKNPRLGMLFPPPIIHGPYYRLLSNLWTGNYFNTVDVAKKLNINVMIERNIDPVFPTGGMFWFKSKALKNIIDYNWKFDDFVEEPMPEDGTLGHAVERVYCFAAQNEGYYSAWLMSDNFTKNEITSLSYILSTIKKSPYAIFRQGVVNKLQKYPGMFGVLRNWFRFAKKIGRKIIGKS